MKILTILLVGLLLTVNFATLFGQNNGDPNTVSASIVLTWTDNSVIETGFIIERAPKPATGTAPSASFVEVARVNANILTWTDTALPVNTSYSYRVRAFNLAGSSEPSNISSATTPAAPRPIVPSDLKTAPVPLPPR